MAFISPSEGLIAPVQRQKFGRYATYGKESYGKHHYGLSVLQAGIYKRIRYQGIVRRVYIPFYPYKITHSEQQTTNRTKFGDAVAAWQALTESQKEVYRSRVIGKPLSGYNLYLREAMLS